MADPTFSRIEISLRTKADIETARKEILDLAAALRKIHNSDHGEEEVLILARHQIKTTSQKLRNGN